MNYDNARVSLDDDPTSRREKKNGTNLGHNENSNGKEFKSYNWSPLLVKSDNMTDCNSHNNMKNGVSKNNNEWKENGATNGKDVYERYKYWPELEENNLKKLSKSNNNGSLINSKGLLGNGNGYPAELDPLTGVERNTTRDVNDDEYSRSNCGLGSCQPKWARSFASTHVFMVVFLLAWILQVNYNFIYIIDRYPPLTLPPPLTGH